MAKTVLPFSVPALQEFRDSLELGDGLFREITGLDVSVLYAYRRGKLKEKPVLSEPAIERIARCKKALQLALELTGDEERALDWLYTDSPTFGGRSPIDLTVNDAGLDFISDYIAKLRTAVLGTAPPPAATSAVAPKPPTPTAAPTKASPPPAAPRLVERPKEVAPTRSPAPAAPTPAPAAPPTSAGPKDNAPAGLAKARREKEVSIEPAPSNVPLDTVKKPVVENKPIPEEKPVLKEVAKETTVPSPPPPPVVEIQPIEIQSPKLPAGLDPERRIFRLKEPLKTLRAKKPELSLKEISQQMVQRGYPQFKAPTYMSRLSNSYTWATWNEVVQLAEILGADPHELGSVWTQNP